MEVIRTPDECFDKINDWPFEPRYLNVLGDIRMHYVEEGKGETILCLHGEPSWAYLYRKMIPTLSEKYKVIAPDLLGFGRSDKPLKKSDYTFQMHFSALKEFLEEKKLNEITVVVQDWGGLLGLSLVGAMPEKFKRLVIMNTSLPIGDKPMPPAFKAWKTFSQTTPILPIGKIIKMGTHRKLSKATVNAYNAPFPSGKYKAGARVFPALVPDKPTSEGVTELKQARAVLKEWDKPALVMFSDKDPIMSGAWKWFYYNIPTAKDQPKITIKDAGHFLQEDAGEEIAQHIVDFMDRTCS